MAGTKRLQSEFQNLLKREDLANFVAVPEEQNIFEWHFCVFGLVDSPFEGGFYHGKLSFPRDYPFKPPGIQMWTPNGRFAPNKRICTNFSDYHPELWIPSWTVSTIIIGLISFMDSDEVTAGAIRTTDSQKRLFAMSSLDYNFKNITKFEEMFKPYFASMGIDPVTNRPLPKKDTVRKPEGMSLIDFDALVQSKQKEEFVVIEFKSSKDSESCIPEAMLIKHKHRLNIVTQTYHQQAELVLKYGVSSAPDIVLIKIKDNNSWVTGLDSLILVLQSIEVQEQAKLQDQLDQDLQLRIMKRKRAEELDKRMKADAERKMAARVQRQQEEPVQVQEVQQVFGDVEMKDEAQDAAKELRKQKAQERMAALKQKMEGTKQKLQQPDVVQEVSKPDPRVQSEAAKLRAQMMQPKPVQPEPVVTIQSQMVHEHKLLERLYQNSCDVDILTLDGQSVGCHRNILIQASSYFEALFGFKETTQVQLEFDLAIVQSMVQFIYLGRTQINSANLIDLLELSHQCLLHALKYQIEKVLGLNLSLDTYYDTYMVCKAFECQTLYPQVIQFGAQNVKALRQQQILAKMDTEDQKVVINYQQ